MPILPGNTPALALCQDHRRFSVRKRSAGEGGWPLLSLSTEGPSVDVMLFPLSPLSGPPQHLELPKYQGLFIKLFQFFSKCYLFVA